MKSKKELLEMFYSTLWELQNMNNDYVKSSLKRDLALLIDILENEIEESRQPTKGGGQTGGNTMCKFYNGKEITADNLKAEILDYTNNLNNPQDDLSEETRKIFEKMVAGYPGVDDDIEFIVDKLREDNLTQANLQDVEDVLKLGGFDFEK